MTPDEGREADVDKELAKLLTRAVARERAAWKAAVKALYKPLVHWRNPRHHEVNAYNQALDDLLQRRGTRGGRK